jgi:hypothetical protein
MKTTIVCDDWRALRRNTLLGFAAIKIQELHLLIRDVAIHEKEGRRWAQLPAKPQIKEGALVTDGAGKIQYFAIMDFTERSVRDAFSNAVCAAVLAHEPRAFTTSDCPPAQRTRDPMADEIPF